MSRRLTSLPSAAPIERPRGSHTSTTSGSGLFQAESERMPTQSPQPTDDSDRHLGEDFGIGADGDLQILRPQSIGQQRFLQPRRLRGSWLHRTDIGADTALQGIAHGLRTGRIAAGALFDHSLDGGDRERDAARLDALQVKG